MSEELWGIYYKPDVNFGGVQGGAMPWVVEQPADDVAVDPYGHLSTEFVVTPEFERMWTSALAHCHKRFEGKRPLYRKAPTGGIGAFTPDSFPVFDRFVDNAYVIADSNHGYKMIGIGQLVAKELLGERQASPRAVPVLPVRRRAGCTRSATRRTPGASVAERPPRAAPPVEFDLPVHGGFAPVGIGGDVPGRHARRRRARDRGRAGAGSGGGVPPHAGDVRDRVSP